ncbi:MAG: prepilin-type N-terminal cleavage/methylation domain-containing protein [Deltaproteobacteria bacterium]|nr:prepilin-type N-terminal cleavage/methylation domain-containing protein [Deltaproteobacteria bacterium]
MGIMIEKKEPGGFTLIELLVVVAILGILAAIALPAFSAYRAQGFDAHAAQALNTLAKAEEAYFARNGRYASAVGDLPSYFPPNNVVVTLTAGPQAFTANAHHPEGTKTFAWDSANGGLQP